VSKANVLWTLSFGIRAWFRSSDSNRTYVCLGMTVVEVACHHLVQMRLVQMR
jgi:hypothetical protein